MTVSRRGSGSLLVVHVSPVREGGPEPRAAEPGALVLVVEPAERLGLDREHVEELLVLASRGNHLAFAEVPGRQRE